MSGDSIVVIGGGTMGAGIAGLCALSGFTTRVYEADSGARSGLRSGIESTWAAAVGKGKIAQEDVARAADRLEIAQALEIPSDCGFVLEAVPERLDLKRTVFSEIDRAAPPRAILASNTSSLSITAIASATARPDRVVGLHFFNPVAVMPLVEIVRTPQTSAETNHRAGAFVEALGKKA